MALVRCSECQQQISDRALSCPHCGAPVGGSRLPISGEAGAVPTVPAPQKEIWNGRPSLWLGLSTWVFGSIFILIGVAASLLAFVHWAFLFALLLPLIAVLRMLFRWLQIRATHYKITTQRIFIIHGILSKRTVEVESFRVKDISMDQKFWGRILGIGNVRAITADHDVPQLFILGVAQPQNVKENLRRFTMDARQRSGTRDLDVDFMKR